MRFGFGFKRERTVIVSAIIMVGKIILWFGFLFIFSVKIPAFLVFISWPKLEMKTDESMTRLDISVTFLAD